MADVIISDLNSGTVTSTTMIPASLTTVASTSATVFIQPKDFPQVLSLSSVAAGTIGSTSLLFGTVTTSAPVVFQANSVINAANMFGLGAGVVTSSSLIPGGNTSSGALSFAAGSIGQVTNIIGLSTGSVNVSSSTLLIGAPTSSGNVSIPLGALNTLFSTGSASALGTPRIVGLRGVNASSDSGAKITFQADFIELWKPSDNSKKFVINSSTLLADITTTAANGRDQVAAFTANNWVHFYYVGPDTVTSSTLQVRASLTAPPTGPTLQTSETRWAYAAAVRLNASTALLPTYIYDDTASLSVADSGETRVLSNGTSTSMTAVDCSNYIPPNSRLGIFEFILFGSAAPNAFHAIYIRPTNSTQTGQVPVGINSSGTVLSYSAAGYPVSSSQAFDYMINSTVAAYVEVWGYKLPNGAA
jgi:hypothetical protein